LKAIRVHPTTAAASVNERLLLNGLRDLNHDHIIKLLASYEQDGSYYFIFPLADFSLEELMRTDPDGYQNPESPKYRRYVAWMLKQFASIASGLAKVHMRSSESDTNNTTKRPTAELLDPNVAKDKRPLGSTGYHHDIKPQNLLHFKILADTVNPCPEHGILQIADFGIGKFHSLQSGTGTKTVRGTPTYAAPESKIPSADSNGKNAEPELKLSRPYDVWSLGCVLMEVLVVSPLPKSF
jgi:serine/threonine protein kinase